MFSISYLFVKYALVSLGCFLDYPVTLVCMRNLCTFIGVGFVHQRVNDMRKVGQVCTKM